MHPFCDGNDRTCKILFSNDDKIKNVIDGTKIQKLILAIQNESLLYKILSQEEWQLSYEVQ